MPAALIGYAHPFQGPRGATAFAYLLALDGRNPFILRPIIGFEDLSFRARLILANQDSIEEKDECATIGRNYMPRGCARH